MLPWGVPNLVLVNIPKSINPAFNPLLIKVKVLSQDILLLRSPNKIEWSISSKHFEISPSIIQGTPWNSLFTIFKAVWLPRLGRNPWEFLKKLGSKIDSSTSRIAFWTIFSFGLAIPNGLLSAEPGLGMYFLRPGLNKDLPCFILVLIFCSPVLSNPSRADPFTPGVSSEGHRAPAS